jgi:hypothetical protein
MVVPINQVEYIDRVKRVICERGYLVDATLVTKNTGYPFTIGFDDSILRLRMESETTYEDWAYQAAMFGDPVPDPLPNYTYYRWVKIG